VFSIGLWITIFPLNRTLGDARSIVPYTEPYGSMKSPRTAALRAFGSWTARRLQRKFTPSPSTTAAVTSTRRQESIRPACHTCDSLSAQSRQSNLRPMWLAFSSLVMIALHSGHWNGFMTRSILGRLDKSRAISVSLQPQE